MSFMREQSPPVQILLSAILHGILSLTVEVDLNYASLILSGSLKKCIKTQKGRKNSHKARIPVSESFLQRKRCQITNERSL